MENWLFESELAEFIGIASVSADPTCASEIDRAAVWVRDAIERCGGTAAIHFGLPLVEGEVRASSNPEAAPTVLLYGHFDVQPPGPDEAWESPPFELAVRDGWIYGRGIADDKGQLFMLLKAVDELATAGVLPVNVWFLCDGEEEIDGSAVVDCFLRSPRKADACMICDGNMLGPNQPVFSVGARGCVYLHLRVRTGITDLHSGLYGGAALNASHALMTTLGGVLPGADGLLPARLRDGIARPSEHEVSEWESLQPGAEALLEVDARPADAAAADQFYWRTLAEPSMDVHGLDSGSPYLSKTIVPVLAAANLSLRLAPGQDVDKMGAELESLLREAAPAGVELEIEHLYRTPPAFIRPDTTAIRLAQAAFRNIFGNEPRLLRGGGTLPILAAVAGTETAIVLTGFGLPESNIHAPNERLPLDYVQLGIDAVRETLLAFAELRS